MRLRKILQYAIILTFTVTVFRSSDSLFLETQEERITRLKTEIESYEKELNRIKGEKATLSNQIAQYDAQIKLATLKINQTEEKITLLGGRITQLETSLASLKNAYSERVVYTYKMAKLQKPLFLMITASDLSDAVSNFNYLKRIQKEDKDLLNRLQTAQTNYQEEKTGQEQLQDELENQKRALGGQKSAKTALLIQTNSNEKKYQQLLSSAKSEYEAIQAIVEGKGTEEQAGQVSQGARIASIIQGTSCNSSGTHLHFIVAQDTNIQNPFNYLKSGIDYENCSGASCGSGDSDAFNPNGSWDWPISPKIKFTQGFGVTWAVRNTWVGRVYSSHNGIDIDSGSSPDVKAVQSGMLYRGSYTGYNGCRLRYVRVDHDNSDLETYYLHINY